MKTPGHRKTEQRRVILEELRKLLTHPTADEVYRIVRRRLPRISLATVYRNLETLSAEGLVLKLEFPGASKRFDARTEQHGHIRCIHCGRVDDHFANPRVRLDASLSKATGYRIIGVQLDLIGICPRCRTKGLGKGGNA